MPRLWLLSDRRNDARLVRALQLMPRGSGFIFRHYHLAPSARRARFRELAALAQRRGVRVFLAGSEACARSWGAEGTYGAPRGHGRGQLPHLASAHNQREIIAANRGRAAGILLSPVYPTRSHPNARALGPLGFALLARSAASPVIALGGMNGARARRLRAYGWAAIDGLTP